MNFVNAVKSEKDFFTMIGHPNNRGYYTLNFKEYFDEVY